MRKVQLLIFFMMLAIGNLKCHSQVSHYIANQISLNNQPYENVHAAFEIDIENLRLDVIIADPEYNQYEKYSITGLFKRFDSGITKYTIKRTSKDYEELLILDFQNNLITIENNGDIVKFKLKS